MAQDRELEIRLSFLEEAQDYLSVIEAGIIAIATAQADRQSMDAVLRAAHSIKGGAAMMGFQTLSDLAHRLEDFFKVLTTQPTIDAELENLLLNSVSCLKQAIAFYHQGATRIDSQWLATEVNPIFDQIHQRLGNTTPVEPDAFLLPDTQDMKALIFTTEVEECLQRLESTLAAPEPTEEFDAATLIAIAQDFASLGEMFQIPTWTSLCESVVQHLEAHPDKSVEIASLALQEWRRSQAAILIDQAHTIPTQIDLDAFPGFEQSFAAPAAELEALLDLLGEGEEVEATAIATRDRQTTHLVSPPQVKEQDNTVRVPVKLLDTLNDLFGELTIERNSINLYLERLRNLVKILSGKVRTLKTLDTRIPAAYKYQYTPHEPNSVIETENNSRSQLNDRDLRALVEEVMENIFRIQEVTDDVGISIEDTTQAVSELNRTAKQMQTSLTQVRMRPLSDLVSQFPRFLRELSRQHGKNVELKIQGEETLIERNILEALNDPLMHLLRNAFDHGIESAEIRRSRGKPEQGLIKITAAARGNQTFISISDDGGGIDLNKIRTKAQKLGLDAASLATASEQEILTLIFEPGFSTTEQVTTLSGRGVGLDVVRTNLRKIRGDIKVDTQLEVGTTFHLNVPISLSIAKVLLAESNGILLAFPTDAIAEMLLINHERISTIADHEVLHWEGQTLPLIRLGEWLEFRGSAHQKSHAETMPMMSVPTVLKVVQGSEYVGIQVDRCWGEQEVAIRQVEGAIAMPRGFSSCTILGDGRVVPLVNLPDLLHWIASCRQSSKLEHAETATRFQNAKDTILVVDDSINVRRFLALTLEKAGYRVEQAIDGQDGLEKLLSGLPIQAVISDIDMPRLDGYSLLAQVKASHLQDLPFILLSSRQGQRERQLATKLGAIAYFSKPFNEQELLSNLKQIVENYKYQ